MFNKTFGAAYANDTKTGIKDSWYDGDNVGIIVEKKLSSFTAEIWVTDGAGNVSDKITYKYP